MKKVLVAVFAHPDDEAFGPAGTLKKYSETHNVYLIIATGGEAGKNSHSNKEDTLEKIRQREVLNSSKILGIKKVYFLGFEDGKLNNDLYHKVAEKIEKIVRKLKPETLITFEPRGISGHLDHIAVSMITTYVFKRNKFLKTLMYYCIKNTRREKYLDDYFIYFPEGYKNDEIDKSVDISKFWDIKIKAMMAHSSQSHDAKRILQSISKLPKEEHFLIVKKAP